MTFHVIFLGEIQYIYVNDSKIPLFLFQVRLFACKTDLVRRWEWELEVCLPIIS